MSETNELCVNGADHYCPNCDNTFRVAMSHGSEPSRDSRAEVIEKLAREVRGLRGCFNFDEWSIREAIGNTNYSVAMLHFQKIDDALEALRKDGR